MRVEHLVAEAAVESLDERVLVGLAWLYEHQLHGVGFGPLGEGTGRELGAVIQPDGLRPAVDLQQLIQNAYDAPRRDGGTDLNAQRLSIALINDVEGAERTAVVHRVAHEVQGPYPVEFVGLQQRLALTGAQSLLRLALEVQPHLAVHPVNTLVVPWLAIGAQPIKALPEAPAGSLGDDLVQGVYHRRILGQAVHCWFVKRRPRQLHSLAGFRVRQTMFTDHDLYHRALRSRRHNFRDSTSLIAVFSRASSAYILLSLAFSASSSLTRLSSLADMPAYLLFHW